jgi:hypothetical protein
MSEISRYLHLSNIGKLGGYVGKLISFIFLSFVFLIITFVVSFNILLPGTIFKLPLLIALICLPFILAYVLISIPTNKKHVKSEQPRKMSKKVRYAYISIFVVFLVIMLGIYIYQNNEENNHIKNAQKVFSVSLVGNVTQERIQSTLIELDTQLSRLNKTYNLQSEDQKIGLVLFPDIISLQNNSQVPKWADAYISFTSDKPTIYLPAEQAPNDTTRKANTMASPMPGHEVTHYVIRKIVGESNKEKIPLWFNEGLAQYESLKGFNRVFDRIGYKLGLWLLNFSNSEVLENGQVILNSNRYPDQHIDIFYLASMEFTDYIVSNYGRTENLLHDISTGIDFSTAFELETGKKYEDVYRDWYEAFFGISQKSVSN